MLQVLSGAIPHLAMAVVQCSKKLEDVVPDVIVRKGGVQHLEVLHTFGSRLKCPLGTVALLKTSNASSTSTQATEKKRACT
jgi:hypothetical protein